MPYMRRGIRIVSERRELLKERARGEGKEGGRSDVCLDERGFEPAAETEAREETSYTRTHI